MTFTSTLLTLLLISVSHIARAESATAESKLRADQLTESKNRPPGEDVDRLITNPKMRAETGSKSKYSISLGMGYAGGSLEKPLAERRPNITEGTGATSVATLGGSVSGKYAITSVKALFAGAGLRWVTPLQGVQKPEGFSGDKFDMDNPYFIYQYLYKWLEIQSAVQAQMTYFTASNLVNSGYVSSFGFSQNNIYLIPETRVSFGLTGYTILGLFDDHSAQAKAMQSDYGFGILPFVEYRLSDRMSFHTSTNLFVFQHLRSNKGANTYLRQKVSQNIGIGYAVTRDFYLSPSVDFLISDIRPERSTFFLGANLNIF